MFCKKCGSKVEPNDIYCNVCGNKLNSEKNINSINDSSGSMSTLALIFSFFIPILGLVFGAIGITRASQFKNYKTRNKCIIAIIISIVMIILNYLFYDKIMAILLEYIETQ